MKIRKIILRLVGKIIFYIMNIFPIDYKKIVISSYFGKGYSCNGKCVAEFLMSKTEDVKIVWLVNDMKVDMPEKIIKVKYNSIRSIFELATAKIWIDNSRKESYIRKRKNQTYIQTWHGSIALKKIEKDVEKELPKNYVKSAKNDSKMIDIMVSNGGFCSEMYKRAFWYDKKIIEIGTPRNDIFFKDTVEIEEIKKSIGIKKNEKIILYAPTFRKVWNDKTYDINYENILSMLEKKYGGKWKVLIRLHPIISAKQDKVDTVNENVINVTDYGDMQELLYISDILITDYSSSMFDFMLTKKPIFLYANDIDIYKQDRDFYFDYHRLPFKVAENNEELLKVIENFENDKYVKDIDNFIRENKIIENGHATEQLGKIILKEFIS